MKKITISCFTFFILFLTIAASAQKARLKRANKAFEDYNYSTVIQLYLKVLDKVDISEAKINLAESYRKIDNISEAEFWYGQIVHLPEAKPSYYLFYAKALHENGKCDLAKYWFEKYDISEKDPRLGIPVFPNCDELVKMIPPRNDFYEIKKLPFNTEYDDFSPTFFKEGLIFVSEHNYKPRNNSNSKIELFYTNIDTRDSESLEFVYDKKPQEFSNFLNIKYGNGSETKAFSTSIKPPLKQSLNFVIQGLVYDTEIEKPLTNALVTLTSDCGKSIKLETDESGFYYFDLDKNCCYTLKAENEGYFTVIKPKSYHKKSDTLIYDFPLNRYIDTLSNDSSKLSKNNLCEGIGRTFIIEHTYYDFNKEKAENDTINPLKELIKILKDNPDLVIDIGIFIDIRGSNRYGTRLSIHRPKAIAKHLIRHGININCLRRKGEKILIKNDVNEVPDMEEQHERSRRTAFRVIGKTDGTKYDCKNEGQNSVNPVRLNKIEECKNCPF
jgi:outer membrane protein OmpA-like peptidoglycan-associated protein